MPEISFGTDGWRAVMAEDFTFANVRFLSRGIASYLLKADLPSRRVVVGYDCRFLSEHFAQAAAEELAGFGLEVLLTGRATPTPVIAYSVLEHKAAGALVITASHNPPEYNGLKFIPYYAGPALPEVTNAIEAELRQESVNTPPGVTRGAIQPLDPMDGYLTHLRGLVNTSSLAGLKVVVDPMHGAGIGYLEAFLEDAGAKVEVIRGCRDPFFGGGLPDPVECRLAKLREKILAGGFDLGVALDGDADRFGLMDKRGVYLTPNEFLVLCLHHLLTRKGWKGGGVARTVATTHLLDRVAGAFQIPVLETPVGFKYIGQALREKGAMLGGEESGGMSIRGHLPEKDGILGASLAAEMTAQADVTLSQALDALQRDFGPLHSERQDIEVKQEEKQAVLKRLREYSPSKLAGRPVVEKITADGVKIVLSDGCWVLIRPSGTEPLFRLYAEAPRQEDLSNLQKEVKQDLNIVDVKEVMQSNSCIPPW